MAYYIYMAGCADGSIYTGIAADPCRRLRQHVEKTGARYTRSHPVTALLGLWLPQLLPGLSAELYQYIPGVTLEQCLKGDWNHHA